MINTCVIARGFGFGSRVKEQLWVLLEFMEEGDNDETERPICTADVHMALDQVYRNGTVYLLYGMGVRGKMLYTIEQWTQRAFLTPSATTFHQMPGSNGSIKK